METVNNINKTSEFFNQFNICYIIIIMSLFIVITFHIYV